MEFGEYELTPVTDPIVIHVSPSVECETIGDAFQLPEFVEYMKNGPLYGVPPIVNPDSLYSTNG